MKKTLFLAIAATLLTSCATFNGQIYQGEKPTKPTEWVITKIDKENDELYNYFAMSLDSSYVNTKPTWFVAPAKSFHLWDTISFGNVKHAKISK